MDLLKALVTDTPHSSSGGLYDELTATTPKDGKHKHRKLQSKKEKLQMIDTVRQTTQRKAKELYKQRHRREKEAAAVADSSASNPASASPRSPHKHKKDKKDRKRRHKLRLDDAQPHSPSASAPPTAVPLSETQPSLPARASLPSPPASPSASPSPQPARSSSQSSHKQPLPAAAAQLSLAVAIPDSPSASQAAADAAPSSSRSSRKAERAARKAAEAAEVSALKQQLIAQLEDRQFRQQVKKLEAVDNRIRNHIKHSGHSVANYSYHSEKEKLRQQIHLSLVPAKEKRQKKVKLTEPDRLITDALHTATLGRNQLVEFFSEHNIQRGFLSLEMPVIKASISCYLRKVQSPINFKVECLWRLAVVTEDWSERQGLCPLLWQIAALIYGQLVDFCDPEQNPWQYSALRCGAERCSDRIAEYEMQQLVNASNKEFVFTAPSWDSSQSMYFFSA